jgi:FkbM family methyltransferase
MKIISRVVGYFSRLHKLLGFRSALIFFAYYLLYKIKKPKGDYHKIPIGPFNFYFTSLKQFAGLFMEIFFKEYYYLGKTDRPIEAIDCGANIGVSLLYIKLRAPYARVKCFEPNPAARAILEKNVRENDWEKEVFVYPYALGKIKGHAEFFVDKNEDTSYGASLSKYLGAKRPITSFTVETDLLSNYIAGPVDFLKIDIEGAEFDVLEDLAKKNKMADISEIQLEYHYQPEFFPRPLFEMWQFLESTGFRVYVKDTAKSNSPGSKDAVRAHMIYASRNS